MVHLVGFTTEITLNESTITAKIFCYIDTVCYCALHLTSNYVKPPDLFTSGRRGISYRLNYLLKEWPFFIAQLSTA